MRSVCRWCCAVAFLLGSCFPALGQQPAQAPANAAKPKAQTPAPKKPVVWTDDNIASVRSSSDVYQMEQEQSSAAQPAPAQKPAAAPAGGSESGRPVPVIKTAQQADDLVARDKQEIQQQQDYIQQTQKELASAPDSYKPRLGWRIQSRTSIINELQNEISAVEKQKQALEKQPPAGTGSKPSSAPPSR